MGSPRKPFGVFDHNISHGSSLNLNLHQSFDVRKLREMNNTDPSIIRDVFNKTVGASPHRNSMFSDYLLSTPPPSSNSISPIMRQLAYSGSRASIHSRLSSVKKWDTPNNHLFHFDQNSQENVDPQMHTRHLSITSSPLVCHKKKERHQSVDPAPSQVTSSSHTHVQLPVVRKRLSGELTENSPVKAALLSSSPVILDNKHLTNVTPALIPYINFSKNIDRESNVIINTKRIKIDYGVERDPYPNVASARKPKQTFKSSISKKRLVLKKSEPNLPKHPLPYASKNTFYDENWIEKQERGFTKWLNFIFAPCLLSSEDLHASKLQLDQSMCQKQGAGLESHCDWRALRGVRRSACTLYQSEEVATIIHKLEKEVDEGRLTIKSQISIQSDHGVQRTILDMLLSYHPTWLRIGLETVLGEVLWLDPSRPSAGLGQHVMRRVLWNVDLARKMAQPLVINLYRPGFKEALHRHTLKKVLQIVYLLDLAKRKRLLDYNPCLFRKQAIYKSSKSILLAFSREFLAGEGDVTKHLSYLGYQVTHVQAPIEEFDLTVTNLATDLRDGIRLVKLAELMIQDKVSLMSKVRCPAISRLQKIHNADIALRAFAEKGTPLIMGNSSSLIDARDIVNGHCEKTLALLWNVLLHFQLNGFLSSSRLLDEISRLHLSLRVAGRRIPPPFTPQSGTLILSDKLRLLVDWCRAVCAHYGVKVENFTTNFSDGRILCLLIHHYDSQLLPRSLIAFRTTHTLPGLGMDDSFNNWDGPSPDNLDYSPVSGQPKGYPQLLENEKSNFRLLREKLCELSGIPALIRSADMSNTLPDERMVTAFVSFLCARLLDLGEETKAARIIQNVWRQYQKRKHQMNLEKKKADQIILQPNSKLTLISGEKSDLSHRTSISNSHFEHRDDNFVTVNENCKTHSSVTAAVIIQRFFRRALFRRQVKTAIEAHKAATLIQAVYRGFAIRRQCILDQKRQDLVKCLAASKIQACYRQWRLNTNMIIIQRNLPSLIRSYHQATVTLQRIWRRKQALKRWKVVQIFVTDHLVTAKQQSECKRLYDAASVIQHAYRRHRLRHNLCLLQHVVTQHIAERHRAAITLLHWFRTLRVRKNIALIVAHVNAYLQSREHAANRLQTLFRARRLQLNINRVQNFVYFYLLSVRQDKEKRRAAAVLIQQWFRKKRLVLHISALQTYVTQRIMMRREAADVLLDWLRTIRVRRNVERFQQYVHNIIQSRQQAARKIQTWYRQQRLKRHLAVLQTCITSFLAKRNNAAQQIQHWYRQRRLTKHISCLRQFSISEGKSRRNAGKILLKWLRSRRTNRNIEWIQRYCTQFVITNSKVKCIQQWWRRRRLEKNISFFQTFVFRYLEQRKKAAMFIQNCFKKKRLENNLLLVQNFVTQNMRRRTQAAILLQCWYRQHRLNKNINCVQEYVHSYIERRYDAVIKLQTFFRCSRLNENMFAIQNHVIQYLHKRNEAAIVLQKWYCFQRLKRNILFIQQYVKAHLDKRIEATITLQHNFRRKRLNKNLKLLKDVVHNFVHKRQAAIVKLQKWYRARRLMKNIDLLQRFVGSRIASRRNAACRIQLFYRQYRLKRNLELVQHYVHQYSKRRRQAVLRLQQWFRRRRLCKMMALVQEYTIQYTTRCRNACLLIQKWFRYRRVCKNMAVLQEYVHQHIQQTHLDKKACLIQVWWHQMRIERLFRLAQNHVLSLIEQNRNTKREAAIIVVQSRVRGWLARRRLHKMEISARHIQRVWRMHRLKRSGLLEPYCKAAIVVQRAFRFWMKQKCKAALVLQTWWRSCVLRKSFIQQRKAAVVIQSNWRCYTAHRKFISIQHAVCVIQRFWLDHLNRRHKAASIIQLCWQSYRHRQYMLMGHRAALTIQRVWRGSRVRACMSKHLKERVSIVRGRLMEAEKRSTKQDTLGYRARMALDSLLDMTQVAHVISALGHLEVVTRLIPDLCLMVTERGAAPALVTLIRSCNRSVAHMDIILYAIKVLFNLARHVPSRRMLLIDQSSQSENKENKTDNQMIGMLVDVIAMTLNAKLATQGSVLFTRSTSLLALLCMEPNTRAQLRADEKTVARLTTIHTTLNRRHNLTTAKFPPPSSLTSRNAKPISKQKQDRLQLELDPDWVVIRGVRPQASSLAKSSRPSFRNTVSSETKVPDPLLAINYLMAVLNKKKQ